jgi:hypothetical protein
MSDRKLCAHRIERWNDASKRAERYSPSRHTLPRAGVGRKPVSHCGGASASLKTVVSSRPLNRAFILFVLQQPHGLYRDHQQRHSDSRHSDRAKDI